MHFPIPAALVGHFVGILVCPRANASLEQATTMSCYLRRPRVGQTSLQDPCMSGFTLLSGSCKSRGVPARAIRSTRSFCVRIASTDPGRSQCQRCEPVLKCSPLTALWNGRFKPMAAIGGVMLTWILQQSEHTSSYWQCRRVSVSHA